jgi:alkanesulfonate monooxygenase SsuD/methylene tetrahydromethanopterin reductase-like flavin-dependent oxidoreductase (luciferase family)
MLAAANALLLQQSRLSSRSPTAAEGTLTRAPLKFGVLQFFGWPQRGEPLNSVYESALERVRIMDNSGYEAIWLAEHHFTGYSVCPSVHMMGVHIANHTKRLRIGTAVSLAAFYHPLRLAEEVALLDVLSGGRVNWGAGRGFDPTEFTIFGVRIEDSGRRFHEAVKIVEAAWTQQRMTFRGEFWQFENVEVLPKPLQTPRPPIWLAAGSEGAVRWAGKHGYSMMLGPHSTFAENAAHYELYLSERRAAGWAGEPAAVPMARFVAVADDDAEAARIAERGARWVGAAYMNSSKATRPASADQSVLTMEAEAKLDRYLSSAVIHGSPGRVIDTIERLREQMHLEYLMMAPLSRTSFLKFTDQVLPHFL